MNEWQNKGRQSVFFKLSEKNFSGAWGFLKMCNSIRFANNITLSQSNNKRDEFCNHYYDLIQKHITFQTAILDGGKRKQFKCISFSFPPSELPNEVSHDKETLKGSLKPHAESGGVTLVRNGKGSVRPGRGRRESQIVDSTVLLSPERNVKTVCHTSDFINVISRAVPGGSV